MNFLAHIYLSGNNQQIMLGNFIADYVKGNQYEKYAPEVQKGILLHRKIDGFTDKHPIVKQSAQRFKESYGRYSSVVIDVVYDHYLANAWPNYSSVPLGEFVSKTHQYLMKNYFMLPARVKGFLPFLIKSRRLENYKNLQDIERSLAIMAKNTSLPDKSEEAIEVMSNHYPLFEDEFALFFSEMRQMVHAELNP
ncbi:ACP phosphodiesterase [Saccharicrinis aurantiacus]|uniref:acyl carrier protein phosphodiesterase n=1 Tax=Saccharicrinis aurantiacus TaxID=1849719 RepID=UPI0024921F80|nr:ACP phosphodiesterase [Saccharicrinis aurantiacus]